jgi:CheY-like chemotaxis protein
MKKKILIADISDYKKTLGEIYSLSGFDVTFCDSAFDAISKLKAYDFDLVVSEVELPGDNAFELYDYISENYPGMPTIMVTDKNIDTFFSRVFSQGIGNVLHKPVNESELITLSIKLITGTSIFGLRNYLDNVTDIKKIRIKSSDQIKKAVAMIIDQVSEWGFSINRKSTLTLLLNEMAINAVYHSHGFTAEKLKRVSVNLPENSFVDIFFCRADDTYAISITDYNGKLTKERILESINDVIKQNMLLEKSFETGEDISDLISESGRGIDLVRKLSGEYYFIIKKDFRTEIILIFKESDAQSRHENTSLKIIDIKY